DWALISETTWNQKTNETTNENVWIPSFSKKLKALDKKEVSITGYISVDANGNHILTQFKRNSKSTKDHTAEAPDYILLEGFDEATYYAELKKYQVKGFLVLSEYSSANAAIALRMSEILR
ncbi:MAG: hypothetical protein ACKVOR_05545, partial [Flavobacteriales bacterium]